ncbi:FMN-binding negative transcriptional regulator [Fluviicola sp.]|jgi:transcriptional regulator|uniref:FMN-binding negative transcriptional regulator n=1 Tax=Fluviicola sp. TaxID=1917219 RepID=UPI00281DE771|nr:FMN-binding negative transcriptional regulator [Fluviicola sp.]MDR0802173.1 FMN-binding negative transcriptional regulator [Fluviicola sp.]
MYIPTKFELKDQKLILEFLQQHPFGTLAVNGADGFPVLVHIPFTCRFGEVKSCLEFHVAFENEIVPAIRAAGRGKMVVLGAHGYVSSSVYTHVNVPTYNYQAVHVSGKLKELDDSELQNHLTQLVDAFESGRKNKMRMDQWPAGLIEAYKKEITGFRIEVERTEAAFKLSQNRNEIDFDRILNDLSDRTLEEKQLAEAMKQTKCPVQ